MNAFSHFLNSRASSSVVRLGRRGMRNRRGTYTVEFAICASVLFMTIFAVFEFSRFTFIRQAVDQAAYEAARVGIVPGASNSDIQFRAESLLAAAGIRNATVAITPAVIDDATTEVAVEISCNFGENSWIPNHFLPTTEFVSRTVLDHENQAFLIPENAASDSVLTENDEPQDV